MSLMVMLLMIILTCTLVMFTMSRTVPMLSMMMTFAYLRRKDRRIHTSATVVYQDPTQKRAKDQ